MADVETSLLTRLRAAAREKVAADPSLARTLLTGGAGALMAGVPLAMAMHAHEEAARQKARNVGFGAGVATGLVGPRVLHGLDGLVRGAQ